MKLGAVVVSWLVHMPADQKVLCLIPSLEDIFLDQPAAGSNSSSGNGYLRFHREYDGSEDK